MAVLLALLLAVGVDTASAEHVVSLDALDPTLPWQLRALRFRGQRAISSPDLRAALATKPPAWYAPWRPRPAFDPMAFRSDVERLRRLYESRGYYHARLEVLVEVPDDDGDSAVTVVVQITEGPPVRVTGVDVELTGAALGAVERERLLADLPLSPGDVFAENAYEGVRTALVARYRDRGYARVAVTKHAEVDVASNEARVRYVAASGPPCVFGEVRISGAIAVDPEVVRREIAFEPSEPFHPRRLEKTRQNLAALNLFRSIRLDEDRTQSPRVAVYIRLDEAPPREVRLGVGYDTDEYVRGIASWRHYDFLGGARQLGFTARVSVIRRSLAADFVQPHFPVRRTRLRMLVSEEQEDEDAYDLDRTRGAPRLEWQPTERTAAYVFYRAEYDSLDDVPRAVETALPGAAPKNSVLSGAGFGADWNATDDALDPTRGVLLTSVVEPVGGVLGGEISFVRVIGEARFYWPLCHRLVTATRVRLGSASPFGDTPEVPLFERFYAGGVSSVRGYERWAVGPRAGNNDPIGGQSLIETSVELRHPLTDALGAVVFLDAGQVSLSSFTFPVGDLQLGVGAGLRYRTPIGPLRVDLGFPLDRRRGDPAFQVQFSIGPGF